MLPLGLVLPHPLPFLLQRRRQLVFQHAAQEASFAVAVEERDDALPLFRCREGFVVREFAGEKQVRLNAFEDAVSAPGADTNAADLDVFYLFALL